MKSVFWREWVDLPDAVRLPGGKIVSLAADEYERRLYDHEREEPEFQATYVGMAEGVRMRLEDFAVDSEGVCSMEILAPKDSVFVYGGCCYLCGGEISYSEDARTGKVCVRCLALG